MKKPEEGALLYQQARLLCILKEWIDLRIEAKIYARKKTHS